MAHGDTIGPCPPGPCRTLGETCNGGGCPGLVCGVTNVCLLQSGRCASECDCLAGRHCSDHFDNSCRACRQARQTCSAETDCCRLDATCGTSACDQTNRCCLAVRGRREADCDCRGAHTTCGFNGGADPDHTVCCRIGGGSCGDTFDCCLGFTCLGADNTCCASLDGPCNNDDDCCPDSDLTCHPTLKVCV